MNKSRLCKALTVIVLATALASLPVAGQTTVTGLNTYPTDQNNVQNALNAIVPGGTVVLQGTFDFGPDGSVTISKKDVTLTGNGASIRGGGTPYSGVSYNYAIAVTAGGVKVNNIMFVDPIPVQGSRVPCAIYVYAPGTVPSDNPIVVENNEIATNYVGIMLRLLYCPARVTNNTVHCNPLRMGFGIYLLACRNTTDVRNNVVEGAMYGMRAQSNGLTASTLPLRIVGNHVTMPRKMLPGGYVGIHAVYNNCPIQMEENQIDIIADGPGDVPAPISLGILAQGFDVTMVSGPDLDNAPVTIATNSITIRYPYPATSTQQSIGIELGNDAASLSNATVRGNKLSGAVMVGLWREMYGKNITVIGNDLSELKTSVAQVAVGGGIGTTIRENIFGFSNAIPGQSDALELFSVKIPYPVPMPSPTEGCIIADNDYRGTGLPGWSNGGSGCISIYSMADRGGLGTEVHNNLINESGRFPVGTGGATKHIAEWKSVLVHDNRIVGLPAAGLGDPGIGQDMKATRGMDIATLLNKKIEIQLEEDGLTLDLAGAPQQLALGMMFRPAATPASWALHNSYPNPFNPSTRIQYDLPSPAHVLLKIYNNLGEVVATLFEGERTEGSYTAEFDGSHLSSGVYFCRLCAGGYTATTKLMLLK